MNYQEVIKKLHEKSNPENVEGMKQFGIAHKKNLGISVTYLRKFARRISQNHDLALKLWNSGIRDAQMIAACIEDPKTVSEEQVESWLKDINSWDLCDHCCGHFFDKTPFAYDKAIEWSSRSEEFEKRASFSLVAWLAVHDKEKDDSWFEEFLKIIKRESIDNRNYVKKAVNWALRSIGKRNKNMNKKAIKTAKEIKYFNSKSSKWIANDALRELTSNRIQSKINNQNYLLKNYKIKYKKNFYKKNN